MTNTKGKRKETWYAFSRPFRKHGVAPLATPMGIYKVGEIVDNKGMGTVLEGMPHRYHHGKTGRVYSVTQHTAGIVINKPVKGKLLAKGINVCIGDVKHSKSHNSFLKHVKENGQKKKDAKENGTSLHQSGKHTGTSGKEPELLELFPVNSWHKLGREP